MKILGLLAISLLAGCSGEDNAGTSVSEGNGTFKAAMGDKVYEVAIKCYGFDSESFDKKFVFASDGIGNTDTNNDGIVVRGDRVKLDKPLPMDGISLDITDQGIRYETASTALMAMYQKQAAVPTSWSKNANGVSGSTEMIKDGEIKGQAITYEVICN